MFYERHIYGPPVECGNCFQPFNDQWIFEIDEINNKTTYYCVNCNKRQYYEYLAPGELISNYEGIIGTFSPTIGFVHNTDEVELDIDQEDTMVEREIELPDDLVLVESSSDDKGNVRIKTSEKYDATTECEIGDEYSDNETELIDRDESDIEVDAVQQAKLIAAARDIARKLLARGTIDGCSNKAEWTVDVEDTDYDTSGGHWNNIEIIAEEQQADDNIGEEYWDNEETIVDEGDIRFESLEGIGVPAEERVIFKINSRLDIGEYILLFACHVGDRKILCQSFAAYWFPSTIIDPGDTVVLYSTEGTNNKIRMPGGSYLHGFYAGFSTTFLDKEYIMPVLLHIDKYVVGDQM